MRLHNQFGLHYVSKTEHKEHKRALLLHTYIYLFSKPLVLNHIFKFCLGVEPTVALVLVAVVLSCHIIIVCLKQQAE